MRLTREIMKETIQDLVEDLKEKYTDEGIRHKLTSCLYDIHMEEAEASIVIYMSYKIRCLYADVDRSELKEIIEEELEE